MANENLSGQFGMDPANLYREELFSDRGAGTLRVLTPVGRDGSPDPTRKTLYVGEAQILTPAGALPIGFEIDADSLGAAAEKFAAGAQAAMEQTMNELREMQRERASGLVIADHLPPGSGPGKIQLR
jgi:hypothetical protein